MAITLRQRMWHRETTRMELLRGLVSGLGGGFAMALITALIAPFFRASIWVLPEQIGAAILRGPASFTALIVVGTLAHITVAMLLGVVFNVLVRRVLKLTSDFGTFVLVGLIYGLLVWFVSYIAIIPVLNPKILETSWPNLGIGYLVYGAITGLLLTMIHPIVYRESGN